MEEIVLVEPSPEYAEDLWAFRQEIIEKDADDENQFAGCMSLNSSSSADEWIRICTLRKDEKTCEEVGTTVPSHTYLAIRKRDNRIVGVIDLRHHIDHPILGTWGGHCGYSVRPSERIAIALELVKKIKTKIKGSRIFVITNGVTINAKGRIETTGLDRYIDGIFVSEDMGVNKPSVEYFDMVLAEIGESGENCIVIGDSLTSDMLGAKNAGMSSVWFMPSGDIESAIKEYDIDYCASSFDELYEILKQWSGGRGQWPIRMLKLKVEDGNGNRKNISRCGSRLYV